MDLLRTKKTAPAGARAVHMGPFREIRMKKTAPRGSVKDGKDRASWNHFFGPVQWRSRASWKQRAGWIFDSHMARSFLRISIWRVKNPSGAVPKSIWRVSFLGDFMFGKRYDSVSLFDIRTQIWSHFQPLKQTFWTECDLLRCVYDISAICDKVYIHTV